MEKTKRINLLIIAICLIILIIFLARLMIFIGRDGFQCPVTIQSSDNVPVTYVNAVTACRNLGGKWRLPTSEELSCFYGINSATNNYLWTRTPYDAYHIGGWVIENLSTGDWNANTYTSTDAYRCVQ